MKLSPPVPLDHTHHRDGFDCGEPILNEWLVRRALANHVSGASRTYVVLDELDRVRGYYALAAGAVEPTRVPGRVRRNMPAPIPVLVLARLAVDRSCQGMHVGAALLQDAEHRARHVAGHVGARALLVHALNEPARAFYAHFGFLASPIDPMTLCLPLTPS